MQITKLYDPGFDECSEIKREVDQYRDERFLSYEESALRTIALYFAVPPLNHEISLSHLK
jgi:hypothetical protein